jgi:DNA-binding CsgD family transcriptional regulator
VNTNTNFETRISNRLQSIFAAFGQVVNDFYLEAGIYFVGGFNAALVSWNIYTDLLADNQPLAYAVTIAIIAFIAVEGLAVYLVGAAAKTRNGLLWFFSVVFAGFFTYAHYQEVETRVGPIAIAQYITLAIPFFVVVGYWARTVKIDAEARQALADKERDIEAARQRHIEDEERQWQQDIEAKKLDRENKETARQQQIEDEDRQLNRQLRLDKVDKNHQLELAKIEAQKDKNIGQNGEFLTYSGDKLSNANQAKKDKINNRRETILTIMNEEKVTQAELAKRLGVSLGTVKNDLKAMNGKVKA